MFWTKKSHFKVSSMVLVCAMLMQLSSGLFVSAIATPFYDTGSNESVVDTGNGDSGNIDDESVLESGMFSLRGVGDEKPMPAGFITSVELFEKIDKETGEGTEFAPDIEYAKSEKFYLKYNYKIPPKDSGIGNAAIVKGVTYVFNMPPQIDTKEEMTVDVSHEGTKIAVAIIHNGEVKITFNDDAESGNFLEPGDEGDFWFQKQFDAEQVGNGGMQTLDFTIDNSGFALKKDINFAIDKVDAKVKMEKTATPNLSALDNTSIDWLVKATAVIKDPKNPNVAEVPATITDLVITDTIEAPMLYVGGSVTVKKYTGATDTTGTLVTPNCAVYSGETITVTIPNGNSLANEEYYTIGYKTTFVFSDVFNSETTKKTFTNTAKTTGFKHTQYEKDPVTQKTITTVAENKTEVSEKKDIELTADFLDKSGSLVGGKINWTVTIKPGTFSFTGGTITDIIPEGLTLDTDSVKWGGAEVEKDTTPPPPPPAVGKFSITTKSPTSTLTYAMGALAADKPTRLTYTTVVDSGYANLDNSFTNKVNFNPNNGPTDGFSKDFTVHYGGSVFTKTAKDYIPSTHTIPWEISFGETGGTQLLNPVITEVLPEGLTLVEDSIFVTDPAVVGGKKITVGEKVTFSNGGNTLAVTLRKGTKGDKPALIFDLDGTVIYNHIIKFNTTVNDEKFWAANDNDQKDKEDIRIHNTAYIKVDGMNEHVVTAKPKVPSQILTKTKGDNYDYVEKQASWKIEVNQNQMAMASPTIVDTLETAGLSYVKDSVEVTLKGVPVTVTPTFSVVGGKPTMTIVLPNVGVKEGTYVVKYKTAVADSILEAQTRTIVNTAVLSSTTFPNTPATLTMGQDIAQPLVTKTGKDTGKWYITWTVMVNQNGASLVKPTIKDILASGLTPDPSSIKLEELKLGDDGTFTDAVDVTNGETATFAIEENTDNRKVLTVNFANTITKPYKLTFDTYYDAEATFKNSVDLTIGGETTFTANSSDVKGESNSSGGSTKPNFGEVVLIKKDETTAELLQGAFFRLGNITETTDANGKIIFDNMRKGQTYTITEIKAPYGYKLAEPITFKLENFNEQKQYEIPITNTRITSDLTITKTDDKTTNATPLNGAEFTVTRTGGGEGNNITFEPVTITSGKTTTLKTAAEKNADGVATGNFVTTVASTSEGTTGKAIIKGLPVGSYTVTETTAPTGYVLNTSDTYSFTVTQVGDAPAHTFTNKQILGSLKLTKTDKNDTTKLLAGAEFSVTKDDDTTFAKTITTGADGKATLTSLPVGTYTVTETKAPIGYVLNATPQTFEIADDGTAQDTPKKLTFINEKIEGTLIVTKTDDKTHAKLLAGAEFTATKTDAPNSGAKFSATTDANGVATFKLAVGTYTVAETKAPSGYVLNATPQTVTIVDNATQPTEQIKLSFTNTLILGSLELTKTDDKTPAKPLEGAKFELYNAVGDALIAEGTTDKDGKLRFDNLTEGNYYYKEKQAPVGYVKDEAKRTFSITVNGQIVAETFINKAVPPSNNGGGHTPSVSPPPEVVVVPPPTAPPPPLPGTPPNTTPQISAGTIPTTPTGTPDIAVPPANGTVTIDKDGKWVYTPKPGFVGDDEFTATVTYPSGYTETFIIKLSVLSGYVPFLPETGEAPRTMFYIGGLLLIMLGVLIKRRLKKI